MVHKRRAPKYRSHSYQDLVYSMYEGLEQAYGIILSDKPDLIVVPLRGAEPLYRGIQAMADSDGLSSSLPPHVLLEVGEFTGPHQGFDWDRENPKTIKRKLGAALQKLGKEDPTVMLLDETQHGVVFARNFLHLKAYLAGEHPKARLKAIAVSDAMRSGGRIPSERLAGEDIAVIGVKRLISMDEHERLPRLEWDAGGKRIAHAPSKPDELMTRLSLIEDIQRLHNLGKRVK